MSAITWLEYSFLEMLWVLLIIGTAAQTGFERKLKGCLSDWEVYGILQDLFEELKPKEAETLVMRFMQHIDNPTISSLEGWIRNFDIVEFADQINLAEASLIASQLEVTLPSKILEEPQKYGFTKETREALTLNFNHKLEAIENNIASLSEEEVVVSTAPQLSNFVYGSY